MLQKKINERFHIEKNGLEKSLFPHELLIFADKSSITRHASQQEPEYHINHLLDEEIESNDTMWKELSQAAEIIEPLLLQPPILKKEVEDLLRKNQLYAIAKAIFTESWYDFIGRYVQDERLLLENLTFTIDDPFEPGSVYRIIYGLTASIEGVAGAWGYAKGGMGAVTQALARVATDRGVRIYTSSDVQSILVTENVARGVVLENGTVHTCDIVVSNVDPLATFSRLLTEHQLPTAFRATVQALQATGYGAKIQFALHKLPHFLFHGSEKYTTFFGKIVLPGTLDEIQYARHAAIAGRIPEKNFLFVTFQSYFDPSLAPANSYLLSVEALFVPYTIDGKAWGEQDKELFYTTVVHTLSTYASDFEECIQDWHMWTPTEFAERFHVTANSHFHLRLIPEQLFEDRPCWGCGDYTTPVQNLYLCGAGTHPGGSVSGINGHNCAQEILKMLSIKAGGAIPP